MEDWSSQVLYHWTWSRREQDNYPHDCNWRKRNRGLYTLLPSGQRADTAFHTYGTIWSANMMQFYVDDPTKPFLIETPGNLSSGDTWPFNAQIFVLANIAVGGTLGGTPSASAPQSGES